jgi:SAM-dependent methyltransferase
MSMEGQAMTGTAPIQAPLWGARAEDWAQWQEPTAAPLFEAVLREAGVGKDTAFLDVGCGAGLAGRLAADRGARVSGIDATPELIAIARRRLPEGDYRVEEMEELPYPDASFDLITGFNSFQYAARPAAALSEAARVVRHGGRVALAVWGRQEDCEAADYLAALGRCLPPPPPGAPGPFALSEPGCLEARATEAGLSIERRSEAHCPFAYPDLATALRGLLSAGPAVKASQHSGEERVRAAVTDALRPYATPSGGYRMENTFVFLIARAR